MVEEKGTLEGDGMGRMFWAVLFWIWGFLGLALFVFVSKNIPGELLWIGDHRIKMNARRFPKTRRDGAFSNERRMNQLGQSRILPMSSLIQIKELSASNLFI
jgi:hypothetical protein